MTKELWKWRLKAPRSTVRMPECARVLSVQVIDGVPHVWALCDPKRKLVARTFDICGAGLPVQEGKNIYVGYFSLLEGSVIFHVFEK